MKRSWASFSLALFLLQVASVSLGETPPATVNAADGYRKAAALVRGLPKDFIEKSKPVVLKGWVDGPESFLTIVAANKPAIEEFKKAALLPYCNFVLNPPAHKTLADELPKYTGEMTVARLVLLEARLHEFKGETKQALEDYFAVLRCAGHFEQQRDYVALSKLIGMIMRSFAYPGLQRLLLETQWNAAALQEISRNLSVIKARNSGLGRAFKEEREIQHNTMEDDINKKVQTGAPFARVFTSILQEFDRLENELYIRLFQAYRERNMKLYDDKLGEFERVIPKGLQKGLQNYLQKGPDLTLILAMRKPPQAVAMGLVVVLATPFPEFISRHDASLIMLDLLATAVAIRIYESKKGSSPEKLEELVPEFLPEVPRDPFNGLQPLHYKKEEHGWVLYSLGPDHKDDGGKAIPSTPIYPESMGDIVVSATRLSLRPGRNYSHR